MNDLRAAAALPPAVRLLLDDYVLALAPLRERMYGAYVYGSLALGAFDRLRSDIDVVAPTRGALAGGEIDLLERLHAEMTRSHDLGCRIEAAYVPLPIPTQGGVASIGWPVVGDGEFRRTAHGDVNAVTWWTVKHRGIRLFGVDPADLGVDASWQAVIEAMTYNLDGYWAVRARHDRGRLFLADDWVEFAVSTLCRILVTLEDREIVSKPEALVRARRMLDEHWMPLLDEAERIRSGAIVPPGDASRRDRMERVVAFITYARNRGAAMRESDSAR